MVTETTANKEVSRWLQSVDETDEMDEKYIAKQQMGRRMNEGMMI